jgi:hypothetical protein
VAEPLTDDYRLLLPVMLHEVFEREFVEMKLQHGTGNE